MKLPFLAPAIVLACAAAAHAAPYSFTALSVPGAQPSYFGTQAYGISDSGQVVGSYTGDDNLIGFLFDQTSATYTTFSDPASPTGTIAQGINAAGQIVGYLPYLPSDRIFLRDPASGTFTNLTSQTGQSYPTGTGINDAGQIVGYYTDGNNSNPAVTSFVRNPVTAALTYLQDPNSGNSTMPNFTLANGINNAGQVSGYFQNTSGTYSGFLFDPTTGVYTTLSYPTATDTVVTGINNAGQVVGYFDSGQVTLSFVLDVATGTYTTLTDPNAVATFAQGINDAGQVVGYITDSQNVKTAFLAIPAASVPVPVPMPVPVPEPASIAVLGISVVGLGFVRHWRTKPG